MLKVNCGDDKDCGCQSAQTTTSAAEGFNRSAKFNNSTKTIRFDQFEGRQFMVIPVVMMRYDVVMNSVRVPSEEMLPVGWDGVPVTVGHPEVGGGFVSANSPAILQQFAVGTIFNSHYDAGVLKAEAWVDLEKANSRFPGLVDQIMGSGNMDVSTGFFSKDTDETGHLNGRAYNKVAHAIVPDHLALLPGDTGACSFEDGCGVRNNKKEKTMSSKIKDHINNLLSSIRPKTNERGKDDDWRQIMADLVSDDRSPFLPEDIEGLSYMSYETLMKVRNQYLGEPAAPAVNKEADEEEADKLKAEEEADKAKAKEEEKAAKTPATNSTKPEGGPSVTDPVKKDGMITLSANALDELVARKVAEGLKANSLSAEDQAAIAHAKTIVANNRQSMIDKIVANSDMTSESLSSMSDESLQIVANGLRPVADYSGRAAPVVNAETSKDPAVEAMTSAPTIDALLTNRKVK